MPLTPGTRLGLYEVLSALGAGGMGEVYRARDTKLDRDIALKVLPDVFAGDPDRVARFEREAKTLASLNHPNIATVYDAGSFERGAYIAMELVEGDDLSVLIAGHGSPEAENVSSRPRASVSAAERGGGAPRSLSKDDAHLRDSGLPLDEALSIARQIATALEAAHDQGVIHRDLKPANVKVRADGTVKVLDFGLAKALGPEGTSADSSAMNSPTLTARMTQMGVILGTAAYMAPEQAKGKAVDKRADIWSFGVVLHEMLTRQSMFLAETIPETLAHVMTRPVDLAALPETTPRRVRELLARCLEKDPRKRLRDIGEARLVLEDPAIAAPEGIGASKDSASPGPPASGSAPLAPTWQRLLPWTLAALGIGAAIVQWAPWRTPPVAASVPARFSYTLPEGIEFTRAGRQNLALSPDGTMIAFTANDQIYIRRMGELEAQPLRGTNIDPLDLVFSPDSQSIAFFAPATVRGDLNSSSLKKIAVAGGAPVTLCPTTQSYGMHWAGDRIVFSQGSSILAVAATGGMPETLVTIVKESGETLSRPQLVNSSRDLIYTVRQRNGQFDDAQVVIQPAAGGTRRILIQGGSDGRLASTGHLLWVHDSTLFAQPATVAAELSGGPVPVLEGVQFTATTGAGKFAVADNGTIAFLPGSGDALSDLVWVDRQGREEGVGAPMHGYIYPRISPDGSRVAADASDGEVDIWIWDFARKAISRLTSGPDRDLYPNWTPDGRHVIFRSDVGAQGDLFRRAADGTGTLEQLTKTPATDTPHGVLPDGRVIASVTDHVPLANVLTPDAKSDSKPTRVIPSVPAQQINVEVSPDGRWIAYQSPEGSTLDEVHVRPFPNTDGGHWQISSGGGRVPMWSKNGRELFFLSRNPTSRLMVVPVQTSPGRPDFVYGTPTQALDTTKWRGGAIGRPFDISPDGQRFLVVIPQTLSTTTRPTITVITNWFDELRARAKGK